MARRASFCCLFSDLDLDVCTLIVGFRILLSFCTLIFFVCRPNEMGTHINYCALWLNKMDHLLVQTWIVSICSQSGAISQWFFLGRPQPKTGARCMRNSILVFICATLPRRVCIISVYNEGIQVGGWPTLPVTSDGCKALLLLFDNGKCIWFVCELIVVLCRRMLHYFVWSAVDETV